MCDSLAQALNGLIEEWTRQGESELQEATERSMLAAMGVAAMRIHCARELSDTLLKSSEALTEARTASDEGWRRAAVNQNALHDEYVKRQVAESESATLRAQLTEVTRTAFKAGFVANILRHDGEFSERRVWGFDGGAHTAQDLEPEAFEQWAASPLSQPEDRS